MGKSVEWESWSAKESYPQLVQSTPVHLRGLLKLDKKQALPVFEFSVKFPEDTFVAKTWEAEDGLNLVYTFHSVNERRKGNASGKGLKESNKVSSMVGQMQQRKSVSSQGNPGCPTDDTKDPKISSEHSLDRGGPVFVAVYQPVQTLVVAIMASAALGEEFYLGGIIGAVLIIIGLYLVLWGKNEEQKFAMQKAVAIQPPTPDHAVNNRITAHAHTHIKSSLAQPLLAPSSDNV